MSKELEVLGIERMEIELKDLHKQISRVNPFGDESRKYDYLTYRIEILKRDIQIAQLQSPIIRQAMIAPPPTIYVKQALTQPTLDELRESISQRSLKHFREYGLICSFKDNHKRIIIYNGKGWERRIEVGTTGNINGLDDLPLDLAHDITTYFMRLETKQ